MAAATELMTKYAAYHRDRRNIATHFVGIPLIVFAVGGLLARPAFTLGGLALTPAALLWALSALWYLSRGNLALGVATSLVNLLLILSALPLGQLDTAAWLAWSLGAFAVGWAIQFIGHYYEGRKPAFVDDIRGLLVGPMFVVAEALFGLGWGKALAAEIEARVGPTRLRDLHAPAAR
ncbi:MAG TPA: Mpo1-like protein [Burkholderiaceae bacterium]|jgi:uncharacterized membrane protein YGL010W|nr:Mpo1-like protein [Burkholderiaceae bacterium]